MATRKPAKRAPTYVLTHFCTPGFNTQPKKEEEHLEVVLYPHANRCGSAATQVQVYKKFPLLHSKRTQVSTSTQREKMGHSTKGSAIAQREVAKTNACLPAEFGEDFVKEEG